MFGFWILVFLFSYGSRNPKFTIQPLGFYIQMFDMTEVRDPMSDLRPPTSVRIPA
jgi:hypothetical protein